jgi:S-adenosylmethionine hydrolase
MIVVFTDFGLQGPYTGQMKAVLHQFAPAVPTIDLFADAPVGNPKASAYLLAAYAQWFAPGNVFLCVVDPGVGGTRPPIIVEADGRWYVGPGNGRSRESSAISWRPVIRDSLSRSARFSASTTRANIGCDERCSGRPRT